MYRVTLRLLVTIIVALGMTAAACSSDDDSDAVVADEAETATPAEDTAASADQETVVEVTAVEYAFQGVPETVPVGTELRLFNAGERAHDMTVFFVAGETAPLEELVPPQGAFVAAAFAMPGEPGLSMRAPDNNSRPVVAPIILDTPGRYVLYGTMSNGDDLELWADFIAEIEKTGRFEGMQPPLGSGEPDFAKGMVADLIVKGEAGEPTVLEVLQADGRFDTYHDLLVNYAPPRFEGFMSQPGWNNTLLAPTDDVFDALPAGVLEGLKEDRDRLTRILQHHVVIGYLESQGIEAGEVDTVIGTLTVTVDGGTIRFDDAVVIEPDLVASNGVIHAIDRLVVPEGTSLEPAAAG